MRMIKRLILLLTVLLIFSCYLFEPYGEIYSEKIEFRNEASQEVVVSYNNESFTILPGEEVIKPAVYKKAINKEDFTYLPETIQYTYNIVLYYITFSDQVAE